MKPEIIYLIAIELLMPVLIHLEIKFDKWCWAQGKSDKPESTIYRSVFIAVITFIVWGISKDFDFASRCLFVMITTWFLLFDFWLNITRWKEIDVNYYRPYEDALLAKLRAGYESEEAHRLAYNQLTRWQTIIYELVKIDSRLGYHGINPTSIYDKFFQTIPLRAEILFKGTVYGIALWWILEF